MMPLGIPLIQAAVLSWGTAAAMLASVGLAVALTTLALSRRVRAALERARRAERRARLTLARAERQQRRIAERLHDGPVQDLLALDMTARVSAHLGTPPQPADVTAVVRQLRAVSESLRPPALAPFGLAAAIAAHVERFRASHPDITVALDLDEDTLAIETRLALFRILQEALDNAALHGPPLQVDVRLTFGDTGAELTIRDDGAGWEVPDDLTALALSGRYGMFGMLTQAESVGAEFEIQSVPGQTTIRVMAPPQPPTWP